MMLKDLAFTFLALPALLSGQDVSPKPYQEGDVDGFLQRARANERPAVVLFNFNLDSG